MGQSLANNRRVMRLASVLLTGTCVSTCDKIPMTSFCDDMSFRPAAAAQFKVHDSAKLA
jgi:hypothetical protein